MRDLMPRTAKRTILVGMLLATGLPVLAFIQYAWIERLESLERDRVERQVRTAATRIAEHIDIELARLTVAVARLESPDSAVVWRTVDQWVAEGAPRSLLAGLRIESDVRQSVADVSMEGRESGDPLLQVPLVKVGASIQFAISAAFLRDVYLPRLAGRYLTEDRDRYEVTLHPPRRDGPAVPVDVSVPVLATMTTLGFVPSSSRGGLSPDDSAFMWTFVPERDREMEVAGLPSWLIGVRHRSGSIARAVSASLRSQRWLALGTFGMVALAGVLLFVLMRRTENLALQQAAFIGGISHELRTPLAVLQTAGENLSSGVVSDDSTAVEYGTMIARQTRRLAELVENALVYARVLGPANFERERVQLNTIAHNVGSEYTGRNVEMVGGTKDAWVTGDPTALSVVIRNLYDNAVKYGASRITTKIRRNGSFVEVTVSDDGPGVSADDVRRVFDAFYRGRNARNHTPGTGLGLTVVRKIVEAHDGTVTLESGREGGTEVRLVFPASE